MDELRRWKCRNNHILGIIERVEVKSNGRNYLVTRLILFRHAIDDASIRLEDVDVIANIEGTVMDIRCSCCGEIRTWWMGEAAIERLLRRMRPMEA